MNTGECLKREGKSVAAAWTLAACVCLWQVFGVGQVAGQTPASFDAGLRIVPLASRVPRFTRLEVRIEGAPPPANEQQPGPDGPELVIRTPSGHSVVVPAFWFQPFERRNFPGQGARSDWLYPSGQPYWLARFCPWELGTYEAFARQRGQDGKVTTSERVSFDCVPSDRRGFLRRSQADQRFFETSDGRPFFAIGQNLAFVGGSQYFNFSKLEETLPRLAAEGVNYLRVWTCCEDWALCIEGRKSAWTRTWHWKLPVEELRDGDSAAPGRKYVVLSGQAGQELAVEPSWPVAVRPQTAYLFSGRIRGQPGTIVTVDVPTLGPRQILDGSKGNEWVEFQLPFKTAPGQFWLGRIVFRLQTPGKAWLNALSLKEMLAGDRLGTELLWEADVNRPLRGFYNPTDCALLDELITLAEKHGIYLQLCMLTRDLYMWALKNPQSREYEQAVDDAKRFFRYALARWGSSPAVAAWEYWNEMDPNLPTDRFYEELGKFFEENDPYAHLRTTSTWHPSPRDMRHPRLDIADMHFYLRHGEKRLRDEVEAVLDRARLLRENAPGKPALLAEFGLATEQWGLSAQMKADREAVHFHNALWASALSGLSGTAMFWWWEELDRLQAYRHYGPLSRFVATIPWQSGELIPFDHKVADGAVRIVGLRTNRSAWCWVINRQATWVGGLLEGRQPTTIRAIQIVIPGLQAGGYQIRWFDTWRGSWLDPSGEKAQATTEGLHLTLRDFDRDLAFYVERLEAR